MERRQTLRLGSRRARHVASRSARADSLIAGTDRGQVYHWALGDDAAAHQRLARRVAPDHRRGLDPRRRHLRRRRRRTASVSAWFATRLREDDEVPRDRARARLRGAGQPRPRHRRLHPRQELRHRRARTARVVVRYLTSERTLLTLSGAADGATSALITPKADGVLVGQADGSLARFAISVPASRDHAGGPSSARSGTRATASPNTSGSPPAPPTTSRPSSAWCRWSSAP